MIKLTGYKILKKIGSGGMGDVFLAEHEKLEKKVAIKSLHKNLVSDKSFRERFSQEAKTHSRLDHSNIVKLLDYKERKDGLFLVMEYIDGKQLDEHIRKVSGPIPEKELTSFFSQILDAIGYAHKQGLVHRDIKPSNIMIDKEGRIKVLDFGIAKLQDEDKGLTKTGVQVGTVSYMSPEQVNAKKVDKLTDIYSLGVTLFYMAVGRSPYSEDTNTFSIQTKIVSDPLPEPSDFYPGVSGKFEYIIEKATQKNKKDRYKNCEQFKDDLQLLDIENINKYKENKKSSLKSLDNNKLRESFWKKTLNFKNLIWSSLITDNKIKLKVAYIASFVLLFPFTLFINDELRYYEFELLVLLIHFLGVFPVFLYHLFLLRDNEDFNKLIWSSISSTARKKFRNAYIIMFILAFPLFMIFIEESNSFDEIYMLPIIVVPFHLLGVIPVFLCHMFLRNNNKGLINYIKRRKKNITVSIILILIFKVLLHYALYPERYSTNRYYGSSYTPGSKRSLGFHFEQIFEYEIHLFFPVILIFLILVWFFKKKITVQ